MSTEQEYKQYKDELKELVVKRAEAQGELKAALSTLENLGYSDVAEARKAEKELDEQLKRVESEKIALLEKINDELEKYR